MCKVTIELPDAVKDRAEQFARQQGVSLDALVTEAVIAACGPTGIESPRAFQEVLKQAPEDWRNDPLFANYRVWTGPVPPDLSINHDKYLDDEEEQ